MTKSRCIILSLAFVLNIAVMFALGRAINWSIISHDYMNIANSVLDASIIISPFLFFFGPLVYWANISYKVIEKDSIFGEEIRNSAFWRWILWEIK